MSGVLTFWTTLTTQRQLPSNGPAISAVPPLTKEDRPGDSNYDGVQNEAEDLLGRVLRLKD